VKTSSRFSIGWITWLAWRQFIARRQGGGLSFMTVVSIAGVAIGVGALVLVLSVMGGFEADLRRKMLSGEPHLEVISAKMQKSMQEVISAMFLFLRTLLSPFFF